MGRWNWDNKFWNARLSVASRGVALTAILVHACVLSAQTPPEDPRAADDLAQGTAGAPSSSPMYFTVCGDLVYFTADDGINGRELWSVDETGRCILVNDIKAGPKGSNPLTLKYMGKDILFLSAEHEEYGREPYFHGSHPQDLVFVGDIAPGVASSDPNPMARLRNTFVFFASPEHGRRYMYSASESGRSYRQIPFPASADFLLSAQISEDTIIVSCRNRLVKYQAGASEPTPLYSNEMDKNLLIDHLVPMGSVALFRNASPDSGSELWITDGTGEGTRLLKDIRPGPASSEIGPLEVLGDCAWFQANDGEHGNELWVTDGTPEGTRQVLDICPGATGSDPHYFTQVGDVTYFCASDGVHGVELWRSDKTPEGTRQVCDTFPGSKSSEPWSLASFQGLLYFCANSPEFGEEVFFTDGTPNGLRLLADLAPGPNFSGPDNLTAFKERHLLFTCNDGVHGEELWISDGSPGGTHLLADIWKDRSQASPSSSPHDLVMLGDRLVFGATDRGHGDELWSSDGSTEGTRLVCDIYAGPSDSRPQEFVRVGARLFFSAESKEHGRELWCTEGTTESTVLLCDVRKGQTSSNPRMLGVSEESIYFVADDEAHSDGLWRTDGTQEGTVSLMTSTEGLAALRVEDLFELDRAVYFYAVDSQGKRSIWRVAGAMETPVRIGEAFESTEIQAVLEASSRNGGAASNRAGLYSAPLVSLIHPVGRGKSRSRCISMGGFTYFAAYEMGTGSELWRTDGTAEGTMLVRDCFPGSASSSPELLATSATQLLMVADHSSYGRVLWESDGTPAGTEVFTPIDSTGHPSYPLIAHEGGFIRDGVFAITGRSINDPVQRREVKVLGQTSGQGIAVFDGRLTGFRSSDAHSLTSAGEVIYFVANDGIVGEELWKLELATQSPSLVRDIFPYDTSGQESN